jgi:hypothetical protein
MILTIEGKYSLYNIKPVGFITETPKEEPA